MTHNESKNSYLLNGTRIRSSQGANAADWLSCPAAWRQAQSAG